MRRPSGLRAATAVATLSPVLALLWATEAPSSAGAGVRSVTLNRGPAPVIDRQGTWSLADLHARPFTFTPRPGGAADPSTDVTDAVVPIRYLPGARQGVGRDYRLRVHVRIRPLRGRPSSKLGLAADVEGLACVWIRLRLTSRGPGRYPKITWDGARQVGGATPGPALELESENDLQIGAVRPGARVRIFFFAGGLHGAAVDLLGDSGLEVTPAAPPPAHGGALDPDDPLPTG